MVRGSPPTTRLHGGLDPEGHARRHLDLGLLLPPGLHDRERAKLRATEAAPGGHGAV